MSVTFHLRTTCACAGSLACAVCLAEINLANLNAADLLSWLDLPVTQALVGEIAGRELAARCRRRLWDVGRNHDQAITGAALALAMGIAPERITIPDRAAGYLRHQTERLLALAERAGEGDVLWD